MDTIKRHINSEFAVARDKQVSDAQYQRMINALMRARELGDRVAILNLETQLKTVVW
jgi:hypothetical protein